MANPAPALDRTLLSPRKNHVKPSNAAALQGALTAFHGTPSRAMPRNTGDTLRQDMGISEVNRPKSVGSRSRSPAPPEVGSVRDKIAKFSDNLNPESLKILSPAARAGESVSRNETPQQIAAQLAVARSPIPTQNTKGAGAQTKRPLRDNGKGNLEIQSPIPIRKKLSSHDSVERILQSVEGFAAEKTPMQQNLATPLQPGLVKLASAKPRPNPPRKPKPASVGPSAGPREYHSNPPTSNETIQKFQTPPPVTNPPSSTLSSGRQPALPPRRGGLVEPLKDTLTQRIPMEEKGFQLRPSSSVSLYTPSRNWSTSDILDPSTDVSKEGRSDAIVASSLASSRAVQTKKTPPPPPPQRRVRSRSVKGSPYNNTPSGLRSTLRGQTKSDDEEERHHHHHHHHHNLNHYRKHIIHKHPHKHHEGDRRKWRSEVTEKERKRYEGVWAANKGLLIPPGQISNQTSQQKPSSNTYPPDAFEMVVNLVVRDIWLRSRLPTHVLEEIWDLVDRQKIGLLSREEFVVGMWLIDQQLKGHKLPVVVPDSVWGSVKRVSGISLVELRP